MSKPGTTKPGHLKINCSTYLHRDWKDKKAVLLQGNRAMPQQFVAV